MTWNELVRLGGRGLAAGAAGTAVMTAVQMLEMKLQNREPSTVPAQAVEKLTRVQPKNEAQELRLANATHWLYGTSWGLPRALLSATRLGGIGATLSHLALVWGTAAWMLPALELAPPVKKWGKKQIAIDVLHHAVYAGATGLAFRWLTRRG
ncbi:MAG TPA: hypothetical protein VKZ49_15015 [Polyangiaceae bacterium]|nr:hypothetical protein [Polyangiaceae bacterium]